ncbi:AbrB/MazE/SpoVT family DNA-binding domain-containing protein [Frisingicoccus sp.]|uniref:AbrB/MazE/SpoVT family DNA-binding domain-containing protein n=1 Tax=Frisingicoccus sp. TaxID=1918627 RepID=UPI003AB42686
MSDELIYLDTYLLQQDMRIRLPKSILENLNAEKGKTRFAIYLDKSSDQLVLKKCSEERA